MEDNAEASDSPIALRLEESDATPELPDATNRFTLDESESDSSESDILRIQDFENLIVLRAFSLSVRYASNFLPQVWLGKPLATVHRTLIDASICLKSVQHASNFQPHVWLGKPLATVHSTRRPGTVHIDL